jgi:hypothetical protein
MKSTPLFEDLAGSIALVCAIVVFLAVALELPEGAAQARPVPSQSAPR